MGNFDQDKIFMQQALSLAKQAMNEGEVPVGAVVVKNGEIIGSGYNLRENKGMATAHAEILAIEEACRKLGTWRLLGCTLYVTLEPCPMCAGAIVNSRIERVVYGVKDSAAGCCGSVIDLNRYPFSHSFSLTQGICEDECALLLKEFFKSRR
jgi:tRNA(adenine34) deaminase